MMEKIGSILLFLFMVNCTPFDKDTKEVSKSSLPKTEDSANKTPNSIDEGLFFKRSTLLVANMDRSLSLYRDILGFSVFSLKESGEDSYSYPVFKIPKEAKIKFATLSSPTQVRTMALTEVTGVELPKPQAPLMSAAVIRVDDLSGVIEKVKALGLETTKAKIAGGNEFEFVEQAFIDFDGHLIVLYQPLTK